MLLTSKSDVMAILRLVYFIFRNSPPVEAYTWIAAQMA
jgi:hypothetical protein